MELDGANAVKDSYLRGIGLLNSANKGYYNFNGHGDVVGITDSFGLVMQEYDYDAFGVLKSDNAGDDNPFRYCGEYLDLESGSVYLRNRNYSPAIGRFITEDPIGSGLNWYVYCGNNPVAFIDPSGCIIILLGTTTEQSKILSTLKELTDHTLAIDKNDKLYIKEYAKEKDLKYKSGNTLLRRMLDSDKVCSIQISYDTGNYMKNSTAYDNFTNGVGVNAEIYFDPSSDIDIPIIDPKTGNVMPSKRPNYIGLAHELIHSDRAMRGVKIADERTESFSFYTWYGTLVKTTNVPIEELATVGLKYANKGDITENVIRKEHGLNIRGAYKWK